MAFDPHAATAAYIDSLGADALARAAAYTTGGHWLMLWSLLVAGLVCLAFVRSGLLERIHARLGKRGNETRAFIIGAVYFIVAGLLTLPWTIYQDWWRELGYGRTSQPLADFLVQGALGLLISSVLAALFFMGVYALIRRAGRFWWAWSGGLVVVAAVSFLLMAPIVIEPLFNDFKPIPAGEVRDAVSELARRAEVPEGRIFVFDGSRQSNNFTANVSGVGGSARIAISDVALKGASLDEVKAVTGHEAGHYVLGHVWQDVALVSVLAIAFFFLADRLFPRFARFFGSGASLGEPAGLPVVMFMVAVFALLAQPVMNALIRHGESAADRYSLETVNLPDAMASALVKTAEYRNPRPGRLEELAFYTHPSVERRVLTCMQWKAKHLGR
jgi:STE24 endopeptidase